MYNRSMKKIFAALISLGFLCSAVILVANTVTLQSKNSSSSSPSFKPMTSISTKALNKTLFVPYWGLSSHMIDETAYDTLVYFGLSVDGQGIILDDPGTKGIDTFLAVTDTSKKRLIAVRMLDSDVNSAVIDSSSMQQTIISQSLKLAQERGFDGVVLDFEFSALAFSSVIDKVDSFMETFSQQSHHKQLSFSPMLYGDSFFRPRPYDVEKLGSFSNDVYIMAYDFHKAKGVPGPNFPLRSSETYGYDFTQMIHDFRAHVDPSKIILVYGMYGYDWTLDTKKQPVGIAKSLSLLQMQHKFTDCSSIRCKVARDDNSGEMHVTYTDAGKTHEVWYEDTISTQIKTRFLQSKGISSVGYWAYSYF